jgi:CelD/BcsL family acetyltransferase involved in cellulose biosynthesis
MHSATSRASAPLRIEIARTVAALEPHRAPWDALASAAPQQLPMLSHAWLASYFEHMCPPKSPWACLFAYRDSELVAVLPVVAIERSHLGVKLTILTTPRDDHTQIGDVLADEREAGAAAELIARARAAFPRAAYLEVNRFSGSSPLLGWLQSRSFAGLHDLRLDSYGAYLTVPADYAEFRRNLGKNFRSNLNKSTNKVAQLRDVHYQFDLGAAARSEDLAHLLEVEASGWKGEAGSAIAGSPRLIAFYSALVERLRTAGWLEWQFMHGDGLVLAGNLAIRMPRSVILWKLGYLDAYSRCSPGSMLLEQVLMRAATAGEPQIVDLTTDLPWYDNWGMQRKAFYTARFYFSALGIVLAYLPATIRARLKRVGWIVALKSALDRRRAAR